MIYIYRIARIHTGDLAREYEFGIDRTEIAVHSERYRVYMVGLVLGFPDLTDPPDVAAPDGGNLISGVVDGANS